MKRILLLTGLAIALLAGSILFAQPCPNCQRPCGPGMGPEMRMENRMERRHMRMENRMERRGMRQELRHEMMENGERETIRGRVVSVEPMGPRGQGARLMVESDSRVMPVHIGPGMPLDQLDKPIEPNDRIEVSGIRVDRFGNSVLQAGKIQVEGSDKVIKRHPPERGPGMRGGPGRGPQPRAY